MKVIVVTRIEGGIPEVIHISDSIANARNAVGGVDELWEKGYHALAFADVEWRVDEATMDPAAFERMGAERYGGLFALMLAFHKAEQEASA